MKKIILTFLFSLVVFSVSFAHLIDDIEYQLNLNNKTAVVTSKSDGYSGFVNIPYAVTYKDVTYTVTGISNYAFNSDQDLYFVIMPYTVTKIGDYAFHNCSNLTYVDIPYGVTSIGYYAFYGCSNLTYVDIPNSVTSIGYYAFSDCESLTFVKISDEVTALGLGLFSNCTNLKYVDIPNSVTHFGTSCFSNCTSLTSINLPSNLTAIDICAFQGCSSLSSITIPKSVTRINGGAFEGCTSLTSVTVNNPVPFEIDNTVFQNKANTTLYVPSGSLSHYEAANYWKDFKIIKPDLLSVLVGDVNYDGDRSLADIIELVDIIINGDPTPYLNCPDNHHPHFIDLGLPSGTLWACCNVGATTPEDSGGFFAWGETMEKDKYDWSTYTLCNGSSSTCYNLGSNIAGTTYDVANVKWGGSWMLPTQSQQGELVTNCSKEWLTINGVNGVKFTGKNGGSIFLPAAGYYDNSRHNNGVSGAYWSSTPNTSNYDTAYLFNFTVYMDFFWVYSNRYSGFSVRPVSK